MHCRRYQKPALARAGHNQFFSECRILDSITRFSFHNDSVARQTKPFKQSNDKIGFVSAHEYDTGTRITARQLNSREHPIDCIANGNLASIRRDF
jgi:hypothetical protein